MLIKKNYTSRMLIKLVWLGINNQLVDIIDVFINVLSHNIIQAETELRAAQADYDAQLEKVRKALKKIVDTHVNHMGYLKTFMVAQREFFAECQAHLGDLEGGPIR